MSDPILNALFDVSRNIQEWLNKAMPRELSPQALVRAEAASQAALYRACQTSPVLAATHILDHFRYRARQDPDDPNRAKVELFPTSETGIEMARRWGLIDAS